MSSKKDLKSRLTFTGSTIMREQTFDDQRENLSRSLVDRLSDDLKQKESVISFLNVHNSEWKAKNEELVKENSKLRARLNQAYGQDLNAINEKYQLEIARYVSNELQLKQEIFRLENKIKNMIQENNEHHLKLSLTVEENNKIKESIQKLQTPRKTPFVKRQKFIEMRSRIMELRTINNQYLNDKKLFETFQNFFDVFSESLKTQVNLHIQSLNLNKSRLESTIQIRNHEISNLQSELSTKSIRLKELEDLTQSTSKSLSLLTSKYNHLEKEFLKSNSISKEKVSLNKYNKLDQDLQEANSKLNSLTKSHKDLLTQIQESLCPILIFLKISENNQISDLNNIFQYFPKILSSIDQLSKALQLQSEELETKTQEIFLLNSKISELEKASQFFNLTQNQDLENEILRLTQLLNVQSSQLEEKDSLISSLTQKIKQLQAEIKLSFEKIEKFKNQSVLSEQNLRLAQQLQELLLQETTAKKLALDQLEKCNKRCKELEQRGQRQADPSSFLLQKIESMKNELENYCPSESKQKEDKLSKYSLLNSLQTPVNKVIFTVKVLEEDFSCKVCNKIEDCEICASGHLSCINCFKTCKSCQGTYLSSSIFFRLSRRLRDLSTGTKEISQLLTLFN